MNKAFPGQEKHWKGKDFDLLKYECALFIFSQQLLGLVAPDLLDESSTNLAHTVSGEY